MFFFQRDFVSKAVDEGALLDSSFLVQIAMFCVMLQKFKEIEYIGAIFLKFRELLKTKILKIGQIGDELPFLLNRCNCGQNQPNMKCTKRSTGCTSNKPSKCFFHGEKTHAHTLSPLFGTLNMFLFFLDLHLLKSSASPCSQVFCAANAREGVICSAVSRPLVLGFPVLFLLVLLRGDLVAL